MKWIFHAKMEIMVDKNKILKKKKKNIQVAAIKLKASTMIMIRVNLKMKMKKKKKKNKLHKNVVYLPNLLTVLKP